MIAVVLPCRTSRAAGVVTGSSRGIGHAVAERLTAAGTHVVVTANVRDDDAADRLADAAVGTFGRIDFLVNNAGASPYDGPLLGATKDTPSSSPPASTPGRPSRSCRRRAAPASAPTPGPAAGPSARRGGGAR